MLVIKRINGQVKYALDPSAKKQVESYHDVPALVPKLASSSGKLPLWRWYQKNQGIVDDIISMYLTAYTQFSRSTPKYGVSLDEEMFRKQLIAKLYNTSLNTHARNI